MSFKKVKAPSSSTPKAEKKRTEILKAAARCFRRTGFHQTSMQDICIETDLGPGAVYRYFPSKDAIIEAMADDERSEARAILGQLQAAGNVPDALTMIGQAFGERYRDRSDAGMMMEIYAEGLRNQRVGSVVRKTEAEWIDGLARLLLSGQQRGQIEASLNPRHTALLLTAMWDGMAIHLAYHADEHTPALAEFFDKALKSMLLRRQPAGNRVKPVIAPAPATQEPEKAVVKDVRQMSLI